IRDRNVTGVQTCALPISREMKDPACRPAIAGGVADMDAYDAVFVGFPVWWYVEPRIVDTFLESYDFTGKTLIPFATSGGSGIARSEERRVGKGRRSRRAR